MMSIIQWKSSTGNLADLTGMEQHEKLKVISADHPPFHTGSGAPIDDASYHAEGGHSEEKHFPLETGSAKDHHYTPKGVWIDDNPPVGKKMLIDQHYEWRFVGDGDDDWTPFAHWTIRVEVKDKEIETALDGQDGTPSDAVDEPI
jgi:hypothetical protein